MKKILAIMIAVVSVAFAWESTDTYLQTVRGKRYVANYPITINTTSNAWFMIVNGYQNATYQVAVDPVSPAFGEFKIQRFKGPIAFTTNGTATINSWNTIYLPGNHTNEQNSGQFDLQPMNLFSTFEQPGGVWYKSGTFVSYTNFLSAGGYAYTNLSIAQLAEKKVMDKWFSMPASTATATTLYSPIGCIPANGMELWTITNGSAAGTNLSLNVQVQVFIDR